MSGASPELNDLSHQWSLKKRVDLVYSNSFAANISIIIVSLLFVLAVKNSFSPPLLWTWFVMISLIASGRIFLAYRYRIKSGSSSIQSWANRYCLSSIVISSVWGFAGYFYFLVDDPAVKTLIFMMLVGIIASAMVVLSALLRSFYGYIIPIFMGLSIAILMSEGVYDTYLFGGLMLYLILISAAGKNTHKYILDSLQFQYENQELVMDLKGEITHREQAQKELEIHQQELEVLVEKRTRQLQDVNEALIKEINVRKKVEEKLKHQAYHDDLTKLPNRLLLMDRLEHALIRALRHKTQVAVMFVDLNGFKQINDTFGHAAGDQILKAVAERLSATLREEDTISRFGGDEFVILIEQDGGYENAAILSKKVVQILSEPFVLDDQMLSIGCSIEVSTYPHDGDEVELLLEKADVAMYRAKKEEENSCHFFLTELNDKWD